MHERLNLKNPKNFNEKLQWLKLYDRKDVYTKMVDKVEVKEYVANIIGNKYISLNWIWLNWPFHYLPSLRKHQTAQLLLSVNNDTATLCPPRFSELITIVISLNNLRELSTERYQRLIVFNFFIKCIIIKPNLIIVRLKVFVTNLSQFKK